MRKLIVAEQLSLDGVMQAPGDPDEDRSGGFQHGGWHLPYFDEVAAGFVGEAIAETDAFLFGRRTYEIMARYWPNASEGDMFADTMNRLAKYVASTTLEEPLSWKNSTLLKGEVRAAVAALKREQGGNIVVLGSAQLVRTLTEHGLVDEYQLMIDPLLLGSGKRLFGQSSQPIPLRLVDAKTSSTGVLIATYQPERR
ncbi:MAG TPA: dihydrofolate reductase family protein [Egibacteraceae bacterium]|nr:dihydrofolate reductase family protein [Actinomycetota bacterium]HWB70886.1 dihydrofolate reductase family protein [Egibacteraceae bacterium]